MSENLEQKRIKYKVYYKKCFIAYIRLKVRIKSQFIMT